MAEPLHVELVAPDRTVWSGEAATVIARTTEGDIGVLPGHAPLLGLLADGVVEIRAAGGECWVAAVHGGFLSVANDRVSVLAEYAQLAHEIDLEQARHDLERARAAGEYDEDALERVRRAEARIRAVEMTS
ncbi:F0F1 ATP synthase subunit epsilon [Actinopolymorpha alba]|uniref:F0F1 ATP synthase subunit epsilon n=1 Tax=Actinopolymorpha alba TaxID=533267 RepID=UPI0003649B64|nr:F0F1 ATP synthase subunit epsilon [Actinopolymorpha alba]